MARKRNTRGEDGWWGVQGQANNNERKGDDRDSGHGGKGTASGDQIMNKGFCTCRGSKLRLPVELDVPFQVFPLPEVTSLC